MKRFFQCRRIDDITIFTFSKSANRPVDIIKNILLKKDKKYFMINMRVIQSISKKKKKHIIFFQNIIIPINKV